MPGTDHYALEQLHQAMYLLATHPGEIRERVNMAFDERVMWAPPQDLPDELGNTLRTLQSDFRDNRHQADTETLVLFAKRVANLSAELEDALGNPQDSES